MPATLRLTKHHGLGNDFLVLLDQEGDADLARALCHRREGIGADGLLVGTTGGPDGADLTMVLFNADGSRAEMSGNGIRCLAQAEMIRRGTRDGTLLIATDAGPRSVQVSHGGDSRTAQASVDMGRALPGPTADRGSPAQPEATAVARALTVDMGNPHLVRLVSDLGAVVVDHDGPVVEAAFGAGINIEWIRPTRGQSDAIDMRVWERGAGHTLACGTGACAAAHAAHEWGLVGERATVHMEGGDVEVVLGTTVTLIGPAVHVADVEVPA